jgi:hypothetical protein
MRFRTEDSSGLRRVEEGRFRAEDSEFSEGRKAGVEARSWVDAWMRS